MKRLSPQQRFLAIFIGLAAVVVLTFAALLRPLLREAGRLAQEIRTARQQLSLLERATANEAALRTQHQQVEQAVAVFRQTLPTEAQVPMMIEHLSDLAKDTGVKIQTLFPQLPTEEESPSSGAAPDDVAPPTGPLPYKDIPIQLEAVAGYHQLGAFLNLVESSEKPMQVAALRIATNSRDLRRHHVKLILRAYFASEGSEGG